MLNNEIKNNIIKHQDYILVLCFDYFKNVGLGKQIYNISITDLPNMIANDDEILNNLRSDNLLLLLKTLNGENTAKIANILETRIQNGENIYEGNNFEKDAVFARATVNTFELGFLNKDIVKNMHDDLLNKINSVHDEELKEILKSSSVVNVARYFSCVDKGIITNEKIDFIKKICAKNINIIKNFNFNLLNDDIYELGSDFVELIAPSIPLSSMLMTIYNNNKKLFNIFKNIMDNVKNETLQTKSIVIEKVLRYSFNNLITYENINNIDESQLLNIAIGTYYEYDNIPNDRIITESHEYDTLFINASSFDEKINIIFNKYFNMSLNEVKAMLENLYTNIDDIKEFDDLHLKEVMDYMNMLVNCQNDDLLMQAYSEPKYNFTPFEMLKYQMEVKKKYASTFTHVLRRTNGEIENKININKQISNETEYTSESLMYDEYEDKWIPIKKANNDNVVIDSYNGKEVTIVPVSDNFSFIVTSTDTGFIEEKEILNNSFIETYQNTKDSSVTKTSSVFINQDNLGVTPLGPKGVYYGYATLNNDFINIMGNVDVNSHIKELSFKSSEQHTFGASSISDNIRQVYGEIVINKIKPDYVILFSDAKDVNVINAYKAASEWGIPIIYIDKERILKNQMENLDILCETLNTTGDIEVFEELLSTYESNVSGFLLNRNSEIEDDTYTSSIDNSKYSEILKYGKQLEEIGTKLIENETNAEILNYIYSILMKEKNKYENQINRLTSTKITYNVDLLCELAQNRINELNKINSR